MTSKIFQKASNFGHTVQNTHLVRSSQQDSPIFFWEV